MGIQGFMRWITKQFSNYDIFLNCIDEDEEFIDNNISFDSLFFDLNSLIHLSYNLMNCNDIEEFNSILFINQIDKIVNYIQPSNILYLSLDGVAPLSKARKQYESRVSQPYHSHITPGTIFMDTLSKRLLSYGENKVNNQNLRPLKSFVLSDVYDPGEGEHKIIKYLYQHENHLSNSNICIYSNDTDCILLSLLLHKYEKLYILLEKSNELKLLDIAKLRECIIHKMKGTIKSKRWNHKQLLYDFALICILCGNDFIPPLQDLSREQKKFEQLISLYHIYYREYNQHIVDINDMDNTLKRFVSYLCLFVKNSHKKSNQQKINHTTIRIYLHGIIWNLNYYAMIDQFEWLWIYPHDIAPNAYSIFKSKDHIYKDLIPSILKKTGNINEILLPIERMTLITPLKSSHLLPKSFQLIRKKVVMNKMTTNSFLDNEIIKILKDAHNDLTEEEKRRNRLGISFTIFDKKPFFDDFDQSLTLK